VKWLKHAFAIETVEVAVPNEAQGAIVEKLCAEVVRRRMSTPALLMLEMSRPLNYVSAQFLHFAQPILSIVTDTAGYRQFTDFLERRGSIEYICTRLEALETSRTAKPHAKD
jgi:hypothetical protein